MKSKIRKRIIAFMLCMVLVLSGIISTFGYELQTTDGQKGAGATAGTEATTGQSGTEAQVTDESTKGSADASAESQGSTVDSAKSQEASTEPQAEEAASTEANPLLQLTYEDDQVKVTVDAAEEGNIPQGASLSVTPIVKKEITDSMTEEEKQEVQTMNDQYDQTEKKLQEKADEELYNMAGFLAYDISFTDAEGNKLEPNGDVKVSMEYKEAEIPEEARKAKEDQTEDQTLDVTVMHLEEDEEGQVKEVKDLVADENETASVQTTDAKEVEKAEFVTDSFSTFTITWSYYGSSSSIPLKVVDANGTEIGSDASYSFSDYSTTSSVVELGTIKKDIDNYTYSKASLDSVSGTEVNYVKCQRTGNGRRYTYTWYYSSDNSTWTELTGHTIYLVYTRIPLTLTDDIVNTGALKAEYTAEAGSAATVTSVKWYRSDSENGTYTEVAKTEYEGNKSNISDDGWSLYPAFDDGAQKWYKVKITLSDGTEKEAGPIQVAYYNELQNGSFETPEGNNSWSNADYKAKGGVWQTTGEADKNSDKAGYDIEIVNPSINTSGYSGYAWNQSTWSSAPVDGKQFAELNAEAAGALYQDVLTMPGTALNYWLSHRARGTNANETQYDTMFLVIMPTKVAKDNNLTTQDNLNTYLSGLGVNYNATDSSVSSNKVYENTTTGVMVLRVTSNNQDWQNILGNLAYTPTSSLTRFFFMSGKTASGKDTIGNFLDKVGFSQNLPPVAEDEFSLEIKKEFTGLSSDEINAVRQELTFEITAKEGNKTLTDSEIKEIFGKTSISGSEMTQAADGSLVYTIANKKITKNKQYQVTIKEENADLSGYTFETSASTTITEEGENPITSDGYMISALKGKTVSTVAFTNTYKKANYKDINFKKVWDDENNEYNTRPNSLNVTLHASVVVTNEKGETKELELTSQDLNNLNMTATLTSAGNWACSWEVPVYYDYNGVKVKINYTVTEGGVDSDYVYTSPSNGNAVSGTGKDYNYTDFSSVTTGDASTENSSENSSVNSSGESSGESTVNTNSLEAASSGFTSALMASRLFANTASLFTGTDSLISTANLTSLASQTDTEESSLGEPAHNKYITYNDSTKDYTLNLDVKGAKGDATGVDVLFVIDTSGSMGSGQGSVYNNLLPSLKNLLTKDGGIVDQVFATEGNVNSVAFVSFAGKNETQTTSWYQSSGKAAFKQKINALEATGGTNWTYAMMKASDVLNERSNSTNEKVVIFLSDGQPTYTINSNGWQVGRGSSTEDYYYTDAISKVKSSASLSAAQIYSVYLTSGTKSGMKTFSDRIDNSSLVDGTNLSTALDDILHKVIPTYKNVVITDTLSQYADFAETEPTITVTKKTAAGTVTTLEASDYAATVSGKTVTVNLLNGASLDDGATYTISFRVKPSEAAETYYSRNGAYPDTGDAGTGSTSANQKGFYSNDNQKATVTYEIDGTAETQTASYQKPVLQVTTHTLSYEKVWNKPDSIEAQTADVNLTVIYTDGTTGRITLKATDDYKFEETVAMTKNIQKVEEDAIEGYTPSYVISENGTKATVTNSYSKITSTSIKVIKEWQGDGSRNPVKVSLYRSANEEEATKYKEVTLDQDNYWTYIWNDLPKTEGSGNNLVTYTYAVREETIPENYTSNISYEYNEDDDKTIATITNVYDSNCKDENYYIANVLQTEQWTINKVWQDEEDASKRPKQLQVTVGGMSFTLTNTDNWSKTVTVLKKSTPNNSVSENLNSETSQYYEQANDPVVTDTASGKNVTFTNQLKTKSITVQKVWNDGDIETRPGSIQFKLLYRKANTTDAFVQYGGETYNLTKENQVQTGEGTQTWTMVINNLPTIYEYKVEEVADNTSTAQYLTSVTQSQDGATFTITNTLKWSAKKVSESWNLEDQTSKGLTGAQFELKDSRNNVLATGTSGDKGAITWTLSVYGRTNSINLESLDGDYTIHETKAPEGYILNTNDWTLTFNQGLLTTVDGEKIKGTADKGVVVKLANKEVYDLPSTGGSGIYWYMIGGILLMLTAVWILYKNKSGEVLRR